MINVVFMGTPDYASRILEKLIADDEINVVSVYTQPDKPVGRKKVMTAPITKEVASAHDITVYQPVNLRAKETEEEITALAPDFIIVAAYGQILPKNILDIAPCINLHASILPQYRGASPIQQSLLNGDKETGVTAMLMDVGLDTGDILKIEKMAIPESMMVSELFDALTQIAADLTLDVIKNYTALTPVKQDDAVATHCGKITKEQGCVVLEDALEVYNKYRAFTPWPGIYLESGLKLKDVVLQSTQGHYAPGQILVASKDSFLVGCTNGCLRINQVQAPSKKQVDGASYLNGKKLKRGNILV
jgi:methionyl-tRNA formyltransferase